MLKFIAGVAFGFLVSAAGVAAAFSDGEIAQIKNILYEVKADIIHACVR